MIQQYQVEATGVFEFKIRNSGPSRPISRIELLAAPDSMIQELKVAELVFFRTRARWVEASLPWKHGDLLSITVYVDQPQKIGLLLSFPDCQTEKEVTS